MKLIVFSTRFKNHRLWIQDLEKGIFWKLSNKLHNTHQMNKINQKYQTINSIAGKQKEKWMEFWKKSKLKNPQNYVGQIH